MANGGFAGGLATGIQSGLDLRLRRQQAQATQDLAQQQLTIQQKKQQQAVDDARMEQLNDLADTAITTGNEALYFSVNKAQNELTEGEIPIVNNIVDGKTAQKFISDSMKKIKDPNDPADKNQLLQGLRELSGILSPPTRTLVSEGLEGSISDTETLFKEQRAETRTLAAEGRTETRTIAKEGRKPPTIAGQQAEIISQIRAGTKTVEGLSELEFGLVNKAISTGAISLTVDPDTGAISFQQGSGGFTKPTETKAEQTFMSGQGLLGVIEDFRDILRPENIGLVGDIRATVQGVAQQGGALASRLMGNGDSISRRILQDGDKINASRWFDPNLSQMNFLSNIIAYKHAKTLDPSGRLSDRDLIEAKRSLGLEKKLIGIKDITTVLNGLERLTIRTMKNANQLLGSRFTDPLSRAEQRGTGDKGKTPEQEADDFMKGF
jgi:hypothetical protein